VKTLRRLKLQKMDLLKFCLSLCEVKYPKPKAVPAEVLCVAGVDIISYKILLRLFL
jgi:hypothetical protein